MKKASLTVKLARPEVKNATGIFHQAQGFLLAGNRCLLEVTVGPGLTQCLISPGVVNLCFAIELFLKSLIVLGHEQPERTHKLDKLFSKLSEKARCEIEEKYNIYIKEPSLKDLLSRIDDYFMKVRYEYEYDIYAYEETPVFQFAKILYEYSARMHDYKSGIEIVRI